MNSFAKKVSGPNIRRLKAIVCEAQASAFLRHRKLVGIGLRGQATLEENDLLTALKSIKSESPAGAAINEASEDSIVTVTTFGTGISEFASSAGILHP